MSTRGIPPREDSEGRQALVPEILLIPNFVYDAQSTDLVRCTELHRVKYHALRLVISRQYSIFNVKYVQSNCC